MLRRVRRTVPEIRAGVLDLVRAVLAPRELPTSRRSVPGGAAVSVTFREVLRLKLGRVFIVEVTETDGAIFISYSGDKPRRSDEQSVREFLRPIFCRYETDRRPIELDSVHNPGGAQRLHTLELNPCVLAITEVRRPRAHA